MFNASFTAARHRVPPHQAPVRPGRSTARSVAQAVTPPALWRFLIAGIILLGLPLCLTGYHTQQITNGTKLRLPVTVQPISKADNKLMQLFSKYQLSTPLNTISTRDMAGQNHFNPLDPIFVFLSPGPSDIWYPYAVFKAPSGQACPRTECLIIRGRVLSRVKDVLEIRYQYEDYAPPYHTQLALERLWNIKQEQHQQEAQQESYPRGHSLLLSINRKGQARVQSLALQPGSPQP